MAQQWAWSSPSQSDQSLMESDLHPPIETIEGHGKVNPGFGGTEEDSEPDYEDPDSVSVTEEVPDYESDAESPDYEDVAPVGKTPSTLVLMPNDLEGHGPPDDDRGSTAVENEDVILAISEDGSTSGIESLKYRTGSSVTVKEEELNEDSEDEMETMSIRTIDPETVRGRKRTWKRGVAPFLVQGANTIRLRRRMGDVEAAVDEEADDPGKRSRSKADFTIFIDEKKKQSMAVDEKDSKREKEKRRRTEKRKQCRSKLKDLVGFSLWAGSFKEIEGHFGGATVSYFRFVRWLLLVNFLSSIVIAGSIVLPQLLFLTPENFQVAANCSAYPTTNATSDANYTLRPEGSISFTPQMIGSFVLYEINDTEIPPEVANTSSQGNYREETGVPVACRCTEIYQSGIKSSVGREWFLIILDILQGTEWMEMSILFLGYYFDKPLYLSSLAFLFTIMACFAVILWLIVLYIASAVRANIIESPGANKQRYSEQVLGCWDHKLTNEKAAGRKQKQFYSAILTEMDKDLEDRRLEQRSRAKKVGIFFLRLTVAILIIALIAASGFLLYRVVTEFVPKLREKEITDPGLQELFNLLLQYLPSMALTFVNTLLPFLFQLLLRLAVLTEETQFAVLLVLMVFTRLSSVAFLVIALFTQINGCQEEDCQTCPDNPMPCWENRIGQQMYTLAIIDFLNAFFSFLFTITFGRCCCGPSKKNKKTSGENGGKDSGKDGGMEFNVSGEVLSAVYTQTICWIGAFFCPLILPITALKLFFFFYMKKRILFCCCVPSSRINRASRFNFFFMIVTLISLVICYFIVTLAIGWLHPSQGCSPFRVYSEEDYYMYQSFPYAILSWPDDAQDFFSFISSWAFFSIVSIASIFFISLFSVMASRNRRMARQLEQQLLLESQDKLFLYRRAQEAYLRHELDP